ncbi:MULTISPECIES: hypothetical protein [Methanobacterium]|jgi:hypothetical protein|uniref:Uncharacterized protein n=1 Tax=Methanobacterium formicicum TaxID=2162 RepID=A0A090I562_METFO|nr:MULTISPECIES: hypothetical protein [Methanobacterium]MDH2659617.1 hypothetical protein [Methanobacterium formicicum]CEA14848.1 hypothetical protein DSM1535_2405 [Methanobacterium formicicum]
MALDEVELVLFSGGIQNLYYKTPPKILLGGVVLVRLNFGDKEWYVGQKSQIFGELLFLKNIIQFKRPTHPNDLTLNELIKKKDNYLTNDNHQVKWNNNSQIKGNLFYLSFMPEIEVSHSFFKPGGNKNFQETV